MTVSRRTRTVWLVIGSVFAVASLTWGTAQAVALLAHEERTVRTTIDEPVDIVEVEGTGHVAIFGSESDTITVEARISRGLQTPDHSVLVANRRLVVTSGCAIFLSDFCGVEYTLRVPSSVRVIAHADGGGITATRIDGGLDLSADGGGIHVSDSGGDAVLDVDGGGVTGTRVEFTQVDAHADGGGIRLSFRTAPTSLRTDVDGGGIEILLPADAPEYSPEVSADGGSTDVAIRTDPESPRLLQAHADGGGVTVRYRG